MPSSATVEATAVSSTRAILNGIINANGQSTTVTFDYGPSPDYGSSMSATPNPVIGTLPTNISVVISGLNPGRLYHFRIKATSISGTSIGGDFTLITPDQVRDIEGNIYNTVIIGNQVDVRKPENNCLQ